MKQLFVAFLVALSAIPAFAQIKVQPVNNATPTIEVGYYQTTTLVFPGTVLDEDHGFRDVITSKQPGVLNVLKVKAGKKNFEPTSLVVYTGDGRLYSFRLMYSEAPLQTVLPVAEVSAALTPVSSGSPAIQPTDKPNDAQVKDWVSLVKKQAPFLSATERKSKMKLRLLGIYYVGELVFLDLLISNKSSLPYSIDFVRAYIQDKEKVKRSSIQQREIKPLFQDDDLTIAGKSNYRYTLVIPRFTLADNKQFLVELFERNGGRNVSLPIKNKHLFSAKQIEHGD